MSIIIAAIISAAGSTIVGLVMAPAWYRYLDRKGRALELHGEADVLRGRAAVIAATNKGDPPDT